jgi:thymidylate kinase
MKYIEFLGLPGSGKTTLAKETLAILQAQQKQVFSKVGARQVVVQKIMQEKPGMLWRGVRITAQVIGYRMWNLLWEKHQSPFMVNFMYHHFQLVQNIIENANTLEAPPWLPPEAMSSRSLVHWIFDAATLYQAAYESLKEDDILVQEEGFCQQAYYLLVAFRNDVLEENVLAEYLNLIPQPDLLIVISADPEQSEARMQQRSKGVSSDILRLMPVSERIALLAHRLNIYHKIADSLEAQQVNVVRLDNSNYHASQQLLKEALAQL